MRTMAGLVVLGMLLAGCTAAPPTVSDGTEAGEDGFGPAWAFTDTDGERHGRDDALANVSVLFFMATWCSSCRANAPHIAAVYADLAADGLNVYSLSWDPTENDKDLEGWKERYDQPWPHGVDPGSSVARAFGVRSQSTVIVLDADGQKVEHFGFPGTDEEGLRAAIEKASA